MTTHTPIELVVYAAERLADLRDEVVFLGGAVVGLLITERGARPPRATKDVDVLVEVATNADHYRIDERLRRLGFANDMRGPICRYLHGPIMVDVMPTLFDVLGFANRWYPLASQTADRVQVTERMEINLVTAPCFLATKMEAFDDPQREGNGDIFLSRDFGDVISVIDGRPSISDEVRAAPEQLRDYLQQRFSTVIEENYLHEAIAEHIDPGREEIVIARIKAFGP